MAFANDPPAPPFVAFKATARPKPKRFGWHRRYNAEDTNPRWRVVAERAACSLVQTLAIKNYLNDCAARTRKKGHIGDFDIHECAAALDLAPDIVASVVRVLVDVLWIDHSHVITDWLDQQPELEDPTAIERQRNKRARDAAKIRVQTGRATDDDLALLSKAEQEAFAKLAGMSRVTAQAAAEPAPEQIVPFKPIVAKEDTHAATEIARGETDRAARRWLLGDGVQVVSYGHATAIIVKNYGCNRLSADAMVRRWLEEVLQEAALLATIISGAYEQGLTAENYRGVVEQRINALIEERTAGPKLPFGITPQKGRRAS